MDTRMDEKIILLFVEILMFFSGKKTSFCIPT
jgi:hypothetical protein